MTTTMHVSYADETQRRFARIAGVMYLANYATAVTGVLGMSTIKGAGSFAERAANLIASEPMYRAALTSMAISWVILVIQAYALYVAVKPVNARIAQMALILEGSQAVVGAVSVMFGFSMMMAYTAVQAGSPFETDQLQVISKIINGAYNSGFSIALLFFAPASLLYFYLFLQSGYLPRAIAGLGVIGSALMIVSTIATLVAPGSARWLTYAAWGPMGVAEVVTGFWLAFKGIRYRVDTEEDGVDVSRHREGARG